MDKRAATIAVLGEERHTREARTCWNAPAMYQRCWGFALQ
jgi:hypothetical protein